MEVPILESFAFQGEELIIYLQSTYLPAQNVEPELAQQFCRALKSEPKVFRNYFKVSVAPASLYLLTKGSFDKLTFL